ncbi:hypothetical protein BDZ85DRAFT_236484 [Elsinoe ampelina]|uniref:Cut9 interacting protein Scn1 n=1 Tax=Elsinoe ampelina TaxID=302913 RepID=A0A6A6GAJ5_9PEZI|nr:hypothetical protein BDZ85DRAFT_236484 [Elsinoe ampelina]
MDDQEEAPFPWHLGVFDAHCHPTDTMSSIPEIPKMKARVLTVMSTRPQDQDLVANAAAGDIGFKAEDMHNLSNGDHPTRFLPSFGHHPWFSHLLFSPAQFPHSTTLTPSQALTHYRTVLVPPPTDDFISHLPPPLSLTSFLSQTRSRLSSHPFALVGEIGLDRAFHLPESWDDAALECRDEGLTPGGREGRKLSKYQVNMEHQKEVLVAQLKLAGEMDRAVSVHGVRAPGVLYETLSGLWKGWERKSRRQMEREAKTGRAKAGEGRGDGTKPFPPRICLHSYSGPAETVAMYVDARVPVDVYFSFSMVINFAGPQEKKAEEALRKVPDERVLVESDLHMAGERMDGYLEEGVRKICKVKGWGLEEGVRILGENWKRFVFGEKEGMT